MQSTLDLSFIAKLRAYADLIKFRLTSTVVFSSGFGYLLAIKEFTLGAFLLFILGAYLITGAANAINQIIERDLDKLMARTQNRPLPSGRLSVNQAIGFSIICGGIGLALMGLQFNFYAFLLSGISLLLYSFVYTYSKRRGPIAVPIGAIPGAFPPMIGWVAASGTFGLEPGILFAIQFFWQFPHFWAIAWVLDDDYKKAGYFLLPSRSGRNMSSALQIVSYTLFLLPLCWVPYYLGMTGINSAVIALIASILFLVQTIQLMQQQNKKAALRLMFGSFLYLPLVQIAYLIDKI